MNLLAGHDLTGTAASIAGSGDMNLAAGGAINLLAGKDTFRSEYSSQSSGNGLFSGGGLGVMFGSRSQNTTATVNQTSYTGSMAGSINGSTTVAAQGDTTITGSTVQSQVATSVSGKDVAVNAAMGSVDTAQSWSIHSGGLTFGLSGGAASVANGVMGAAQGMSQSSDSRVKALYAAQAAQDLFSPGAGNGMGLGGQTGMQAIDQAVSSPQTGSAGNGGSSGSSGINLQIGLTASTARGEAKTHDDVAYGSQIASAGNVTIAATGGDLNVLGSQISGQDVALSATHDLNLLSQVEQHTDTSHSSNASGGLGFSVGSGGIGFYAQAAVGKGQAHGNGTTHADTSVEASNTLSLTSGNDATLQGAQAAGNTVLATIGGNLNLASEQDTNDYASSQWQAQGQVVIGMGGSGSGSLSVSEANSHYASVTQMSGIGAGSGGFNIDVGGNTDLKGAVIASTAPAADNLLDTGSLTYSNLQNEAASSAESVSVSSRMNSGPTGFSGGIGVPQNSNSQSSTNSAIAQGTITVRDNSSQDLSGLSRDASLANPNGLTNNFDPQKVAENQQAGLLAGQVGMTAAGDLASSMEARDVNSGDIAGAKSWAAGGSNEIAVHALVGGAAAALGGGNALQGAAGAGASEAAIPYLTQYGSNGVLVGTTLIGKLVGNGAGASTALAGSEYNYLTHPQRLLEAQQLAACTTDCQEIQAKWDAISASQNETEGQNLLTANELDQSISSTHTGFLTQDMVNQLQDTNPSSQTYTDLLVQGVTNQTAWDNANTSAPYIDPSSIDSVLLDPNAIQNDQIAANNAALPNVIDTLRSVDGEPQVGPPAAPNADAQAAARSISMILMAGALPVVATDNPAAGALDDAAALAVDNMGANTYVSGKPTTLVIDTPSSGDYSTGLTSTTEFAIAGDGLSPAKTPVAGPGLWTSDTTGLVASDGQGGSTLSGTQSQLSGTSVNWGDWGLPADAPTLTIGDNVSGQAPTNGAGLDDLATIRQQLGLPPAGSSTDKSTLAVVEVDGQKIYGINAHGQPVSGVNAISSTHAEIDALNQIKNNGIDVAGQSLTLYVDRMPCAACGTNGGIRSMVEQLGLKQLTVIGPDGSVVITPR